MNCRRIQSLLSAYLDGELTGEEMIVIRNHMSGCEFCGDEFKSLQIVKRLLGTLTTVDPTEEWSSTISAAAYAGSKPWWEKTITTEIFFVHAGQSADHATLTPRGTRMVRALALSAAFVFLAAGPFSHERVEQTVMGRIPASMGIPMLQWSSGQPTKSSSMDSLFQSQTDPRYLTLSAMASDPMQRYDLQGVSTISALAQPDLTNGSSLTFVSDNVK